MQFSSMTVTVHLDLLQIIAHTSCPVLTVFICVVCLQMNVGGAYDRPVPADIWKIVQAKMENPDSELNIAVQKRGFFSLLRRH